MNRACIYKLIGWLFVATIFTVFVGCGPVPGQMRETSDGVFQRGEASWYGDAFDGRTTASGERFNMNAFTAAHRTLPFDTVVRVTRVDDGRYVVVRINDRGPYADGRIIDLSKAAARSLGILREGVAEVVVEVVGR